MNIISTCQMGPGTFEAKFIPLSKINYIDNIYVLRKQKGPQIEKLHYIILPKICRVKWISFFITPLLLLYNTKKVKAKFIISYHIIPHAFYAYFASVLSGVPFSISQTGLFIQRYSENYIFKFLLLFIFKKAFIINIPGQKSKQHWIKKSVNPSKLNLLHSTISTEVFSNKKNNKEYDLIFMGRLAPEKNIDLILLALKKLKENGMEPSLVVVGDGPEKLKLKKLVSSYQLDNQINFVGFQKDVGLWLNKAKVFVMASISDAMPTALMQAMACELVCVSSNVGNISDLLKNKYNGFLFESNDLDGLYSVLLESLDKNNNHNNLKLKARETVINFHSHISAIKKWKNIFEELFSKKK